MEQWFKYCLKRNSNSQANLFYGNIVCSPRSWIVLSRCRDAYLSPRGFSDTRSRISTDRFASIRFLQTTTRRFMGPIGYQVQLSNHQNKWTNKRNQRWPSAHAIGVDMAEPIHSVELWAFGFSTMLRLRSPAVWFTLSHPWPFFVGCAFAITPWQKRPSLFQIDLLPSSLAIYQRSPKVQFWMESRWK